MRIFFYILLLGLSCDPIFSWAIDLQPNDIVAPIPDKTHVMLTYYGTENGTYYKNGSVVASKPYSNPQIDYNSAIVRMARSYSAGDLPAISYLQLPYGRVSGAGSLSSTASSEGISDATFATAIWPYSNRNTRTYFALAAYLVFPTGNYSSSQALNMGSKRYSSDLQMGFQAPIAQNLDGMIAIDTMWFGGNSQCAAACGSTTNLSLNQKPLTTTQLGPIYKINEIFTIGASYFYVSGGATSINNAYQNNVMNTQKFLLSGLAYTGIGRFSLQYGRDMEIQNGFIQTRSLAIRYMKSF